MKKFKEINLSDEMIMNLNKHNYKNMTPIQEKSLPCILDGSDVIAQAKTGSGKTAAFGIGLLSNLNFNRYRIQALVLCPTRELAEQVTSELRKLAKFRHNIKILSLTGGLPMYRQELSLKHLAHIVVGTPGRVLKLLQRRAFVLDEMKMLVLDEADRMLDMGFIEQITDIIDFVPDDRQTLFFSATFPDQIKELSGSILKDPVMIEVEQQHGENVIKQYFYKCSKKQKNDLLLSILKEHKPSSAIIFCNTKNACRELEEELSEKGIAAVAIHGDLEQKERNEVLVLFSNGSCRYLIATDVAARGLDISKLSAVINYELPFETETYVHRIGRTGRAGEEGLAFSFMSASENFRLELINEYLQSDFKMQEYAVNNENDDSILQELNPEMVTLSINGGRKNKISAGDVLGALTSDSEITGDDIGKIDRQDFITFIAVKTEKAHIAYKLLKNNKIKGRSFLAKKHLQGKMY